MVFIGIAFLLILILTQIYLFKRTHRIFNAGLLVATILFSASLIYSTVSMSSVKANLYRAKHDAFTSINALWNARAVAYTAKSIESLYLLHEGTGIVQTADNINFDLSSARLCSDPNAASTGAVFEGYLGDALGNAALSNERSATDTAIKQWLKYVEINKKVRSLEYDSKHKEAIALSVGNAKGQSAYEFANFDKAIGDSIKINQENFDSSIALAFKTLNIFPFVLLAFLVLIIAACILGMKSRMDEYRV
jgi:hypothetical protein